MVQSAFAIDATGIGDPCDTFHSDSGEQDCLLIGGNFVAILVLASSLTAGAELLQQGQVASDQSDLLLQEMINSSSLGKKRTAMKAKQEISVTCCNANDSRHRRSHRQRKNILRILAQQSQNKVTCRYKTADAQDCFYWCDVRDEEGFFLVIETNSLLSSSSTERAGQALHHGQGVHRDEGEGGVSGNKHRRDRQQSAA